MTQTARTGGTPSQDSQPHEVLTMGEKFELLSAYMDDEVTEQERSLVEQWLATDVEIQKQYQAQLKLRTAMRALSSDLFPALKGSSQTNLSHLQSTYSAEEGSLYKYSSAGTTVQLEPLRGVLFL